MKFRILILIILGLVSLVSANPYYYEFQLDYENGEIDIQNIDVVLVQDDFSNMVKKYYLEVIDENNKFLGKKYFKIPNIAFLDDFENPNNSRIVEIENLSFKIYVPYHEEGYKANIYNENNTLLDTKFVSQFSNVFDREDYLGIEKDEIDSKDEEKDNKLISKEKDNTKFYINLLIGTLIVLLILLILIFRKKK
jgi:hypothetical protein